MQSLVILGRQPALGLAELESLYGTAIINPVGPNTAILDMDSKDVDFPRLGGSVKLAKILTELPTTEWSDIEKYLSNTIPEHLKYLPEGKLKLGLSVYGLRVRTNDINASGLRLKKIIKATRRSVRIVPNKYPALNSAQVLHNQLTGSLGWELIAIRNGNKTLLAQTVAEQDIDAYAARDQNRPARDAKVGMLPPKLAQILINLTNPSPGCLILDPFCGTGVLLQESLLMGLNVYGSDIDERMIEYSRENILWLEHKTGGRYDIQIETGDATTHRWEPLPNVVAAETYLGMPLSREPDASLLYKIISEVDPIHHKTLVNLGQQLRPGTRLCLAVPAWKTKNGFKHLPTLDKLNQLGYTRISFVHVGVRDLLYFREDQYVARELVVLTKD